MYEQLEKQKKNKRRVASTLILKKRQIEQNFIGKRRVIQRARGIEVDGGSQVLDSPQAVFENLTEDEIMKRSSESLVTELTPILKNYVSIVNYNSLEDKVREIRHQQTEEAQGWLESNSILTLDSNNGGHCVAQARELIANIPNEIKAYPVACMLGKFKDDDVYTHGAAMVAFQNPNDSNDKGYILLDPGLNQDTPIIIKVNQAGSLGANKLKKSESGAVIEEINNSSDIQSTFYSNKKIINPEEAISAPAMERMDKLKVVSRSYDPVAYVMLTLKDGSLIIKPPKTEQQQQQQQQQQKIVMNMDDDYENILEWMSAEDNQKFIHSLGYDSGVELMNSLYTVWNAQIN